MLTTQHQLLLRLASRADDVNEEVDKTLALIKTLSASSFHDRNSLKTRKFFDEPATLLTDDYAGHTVHYNPQKQHGMFKQRDALLLKSVVKQK